MEIWYGGNRYVYRIAPGKAIVRARVNPDGRFPDVVREQRRLDRARGHDALRRTTRPRLALLPVPGYDR